MRTRSALRLLFCSAVIVTRAVAESDNCFDWCIDSRCDDLTGNSLDYECGACPESAACRPGAAGFRTSKGQREGAAEESEQVAVGSGGAAFAMNSDNVEGRQQATRDQNQNQMNTGDGSGDGSGVHQAGACDDPTEGQISRSLADLSALDEDVFWEAVGRFVPDCNAPDDVARLAARGYATARIASATNGPTRALPASTEDSEGPARFKSAPVPLHVLDDILPGVVTEVEAVIASWRSAGRLPSSLTHSAGRLEEAVEFIRIDPAVSAAARCRPPCLGKWHMDPSGSCPRNARVSVMVSRTRSADVDGADEVAKHGNIVFAPHDGLARLHRLALEINASRAVGVGGVAASEVGGADLGADTVDTKAVARMRAIWPEVTTSGSLAEQRAGWQSRLPRREIALERVGCVVPLELGDLVYFSKSVYHRTQDTGVVTRVTMQADTW